MNFKQLAVVPALFGLILAGHNLSAEEELQTIEIHVDQENNKDAHVEVIIDGNKESFVLETLEKGETKSIITESGKTILATKDLDGNTTITIDGKEVRLFQFQGDMGANFNFIHADENHSTELFEDKLMLIGGNLSDEVKAALQATLRSYNVDKKIIFTDQSDSKVMFISKDNLSSSDGDFEFTTTKGQRIKIIKEVEKN